MEIPTNSSDSEYFRKPIDPKKKKKTKDPQNVMSPRSNAEALALSKPNPIEYQRALLKLAFGSANGNDSPIKLLKDAIAAAEDANMEPDKYKPEILEAVAISLYSLLQTDAIPYSESNLKVVGKSAGIPVGDISKDIKAPRDPNNELSEIIRNNYGPNGVRELIEIYEDLSGNKLEEDIT